MSIGTAEGYHVASISCGRDHTLALLASGNVIGWGGDGSGRVAATTPEYCSTAYGPERPVEVKLASPLTSIAAGYGVSLGITRDADVAIWGTNAAGVAGGAEAVLLSSPQSVDGLRDTRHVAAGEFHFGVIDRDGLVLTWGLNVARPTDGGTQCRTGVGREPSTHS